MFTTKVSAKHILSIFIMANTLILGLQNPLKAQQQNSAFTDMMSEMATEMNKNLPMMMDDEVRLDSVSVIPGQKFISDYTIINLSYTEETSRSFSTVLPLYKNKACSEKGLQIFYENGMSIQYNYYSNDDYLIGNLEITPADCGY